MAVVDILEQETEQETVKVGEEEDVWVSLLKESLSQSFLTVFSWEPLGWRIVWGTR